MRECVGREGCHTNKHDKQHTCEQMKQTDQPTRSLVQVSAIPNKK